MASQHRWTKFPSETEPKWAGGKECALSFSRKKFSQLTVEFFRCFVDSFHQSTETIFSIVEISRSTALVVASRPGSLLLDLTPDQNQCCIPMLNVQDPFVSHYELKRAEVKS